MARSSKKGPFVDEYLLKKVEALQKSGKKEIIKTWSRRSTIYPAFVEQTFAVYNGHEHITVFVDYNIEHTWLGIIVTVDVTDRDCKHFKPPHS